MEVLECLSDALSVLFSHRLRSFLTSFGLAVGTAIVIILLSAANSVSDIVGIYYSAKEEGNYLNVTIAKYGDSIDLTESSGVSISLEQCTEFNNSALPDYLYGIDLRSTENFEAKVYDDSNIEISDVTINGVSPAAEHIKQLYIKKGRFINNDDCSGKKSCVVIADHLAEQLYGSAESAISQKITVKSDDGIMFEGYITGVYELKATDSYSYLNTDIYCSYSFVNDLFGLEMEKNYDTIRIAYKKNVFSIASGGSYITEFFNSYIDKDGYFTTYYDPSTEQESMKKVINMVAAVFILIAFIIFIVSGIGLMNTLLISVSERTSEIGIRKALGAEDHVIILQFLSEALILSVSGLVFGLAIGYAADYIIQINLKDLMMALLDSKFSYVIENSVIKMRPTAFSVFFSSFLSLAIGLFFGVRPAKKAMMMQPVDALKTE